MFWLMLLAGGVGIALGLALVKAHLIGLVSVVLMIICVAVVFYAQWELTTGVGFTFALLAVLQTGYLVGAIASRVWIRVRAPQAILRSSHIDQCRT
jgi:hypothetical protein